MKKIIFLFCLFLFHSCAKDTRNTVLELPPGCDSSAISYSVHISPIITKYCIDPGCHAANGNENYDYTRFAVLADRARSGRLENRIDLPEDDPQHMPQGMALNSCEYYQLKTWIHQGFPEN